MGKKKAMCKFQARLHEVVLHDVANDAKLIKVAAAALSAKRLLEGDLNVGDVVQVPGRPQECICKSQHLCHIG